MRITFDIPDGPTAVTRETAGQPAAAPAASDAGPPPEGLLLAAGSKTEAGAVQTTAGADIDGGKPPDWLVAAIGLR